MTTAAEHPIYIDQGNVGVNEVVVHNSEHTVQSASIIFEEDADSRDSGVSMTSCSGDKKDIMESSGIVDLSKTEPRLALSDCSNFVAKMKRNSSVSSSRSSSFYNYDTPTGRTKRTIFDTDSLDQSVFEKKSLLDRTLDKHRKRSSSSMSPTFTLMDRKRSRNLSVAAPQSEKVCRYNGSFNVPNSNDPFGDDDEDDVFLQQNQSSSQHFNTSTSTFAPPAPRTATSLWDLAPPTPLERKSSDTSANGSFLERPKQMLRAMSVGVIDHDLPATLEVKYTLPAVDKPQKASQAFRSISPKTLLSEFQRLGDDFHKTYMIVDCRFPFEYKGGHVKGAINVFRHDKIKSTFFPEDLTFCSFPKRIPIFYCEFSQKRGPAMAHAVRSIDRVRNELRYPHVEYPEMYLLDYGYKSLWNLAECREICEPRSYIPMNHSLYSSEFRSARLERHHSMASLKPNGETGHREEKKKRCTRSAIRRNNSTLSLLSKSSSALNSGFSTENIFNELEDEYKCPKWVSAFDISSIGSEVDLDQELLNHTENDAPVSDTSAVVDLSIDRVVQLGIKVITPDFGMHNIPSSSSGPSTGHHVPLSLNANDLDTPCAALDFSAISDTD
ncbi:hypothetical protein B9Z55_002457 [Caenorhabditis nigoni]|uniref:M-phase inducer phosphatase n=1 Tax=Caenorhabditis nigoni TaxID=1611254 RepID=A0A2G5VKJ0_9PELO|nr:hypothetical protein B9Z55_002457 [Caenorhabditis nigoni]